MLTFSIESLGCKVNNFEANASADQLKASGYTQVPTSDNPTVILVYTCAVTNVAEAKTRKLIRSLKRNHPNSLIVAIGCFVQVSSNDKLIDLPIDLAIGSNHKHELVALIQQKLNSNDSLIVKDDLSCSTFQDLGGALSQVHTRANLKIQDGCNQFCSYCIIPYARGRETCADFDKVVAQAKELSLTHQEIVLTGIHTGRYNHNGKNLAQLLDRLAIECPTTRFRISSIESSEVSDELLNVMARHDNIANHLHIPLQAGCDKTLKNMNRPYTTADFKDVLDKVRSMLDNVSISTDYIVGFVGESNQDHQESLDFIKTCGFSFMHVFPYSRKKGTRADTMEGHVSEIVKKQRSNEVIELSNQLEQVFLHNQIGKEATVLIETVKNKRSYGYTSNYCYVELDNEYTVGSFVKTTIERLNKVQLGGN